jgi:hypothetical protein
MTLYEYGEQMANFFAAVEAGDIPPEAVRDTLEGLAEEWEIKAVDVACYIKTLQYEANSIAEEEKKLTARRQQRLNRANWMKEYLRFSMAQNGRKKIWNARAEISTRKAPERLEVYNDSAIPAEYRETVTEIRRLDADIKAALKEGVEIPGARLERGPDSIIIK